MRWALCTILLAYFGTGVECIVGRVVSDHTGCVKFLCLQNRHPTKGLLVLTRSASHRGLVLYSQRARG